MLDRPKSIRVSKFAASNFQFNLNEGLLSSFLGSQKDHKPCIGWQHQLLLKQSSQIRFKHHKPKDSLMDHNRNSNISAPQTDLVFVPNSLQVSRRTLNEKKQKAKKKQMTFLACQDQADHSNQRTINKIEKMREMKIFTTESQKKKDEFLKKNCRVNASMTTYQPESSNSSYQKVKKNCILTNIPGSQKKIRKYEKPNHCHFIEMEVEVTSPTNLLQSEKKFSGCKSIVFDNVMEKARQKLSCQTSSSSSCYESCIRPFDKISLSNKNQATFEKKLQNFIFKNKNRKVKLTIEELEQFKEIINRKKSEKCFKQDELVSNHTIFQQCESEKSSSHSVIAKQTGICKIRVQNQQKYDDLIEKKRSKCGEQSTKNWAMAKNQIVRIKGSI